ncbi:MAG: carboxypeptidase regulatory-like domain-containing protein [Planctomycetaceae bacterium]|nr:carboxypeptidase regulatory-like domain-containing protein [Planctomycetales bacterium]MCB9920669.1 carboxypeptidase regulatory-like domain-containing protein [Planctomycetaceae bacterium]
MKMLKVLRGLAVTAATFGILIPIPTIVNATEIGAASRQGEVVRDLALGAGGVIRGQVVNKDGLPDRGADVSVIRNGETVTTVKTDDQGSFAIAGISGGVYAISSGKATGVVRAWSHETAPPAASQGVLLVPSDITVRGQSCLHDWLHHHNHTGLTLGQVGLGGLLVLGLVGTIIALTLDDAS